MNRSGYEEEDKEEEEEVKRLVGFVSLSVNSLWLLQFSFHFHHNSFHFPCQISFHACGLRPQRGWCPDGRTVVSVHSSVRLSLRMSVRPFACLSVRPSKSTSVRPYARPYVDTYSQVLINHDGKWLYAVFLTYSQSFRYHAPIIFDVLLSYCHFHAIMMSCCSSISCFHAVWLTYT